MRRHRILLVVGMSGAGKTTALKALEDIGYEAIDHLPLYLLNRLLMPLHSDSDLLKRPLAIGVDVRTRDFEVSSLITSINRLTGIPGFVVSLLFLYCDDEELGRRYTATRHRHPLAADRPLMEGIRCERQILSPVRALADIAIDTTGLPPAELKRQLEAHFGLNGGEQLTLQVLSFSFRSGLPRHADLVFDVRFLANPFYHEDLRVLTGRDPAVAAHVRADPAFETFFAGLTGLLEPLLPRYHAEGKSYLTIAIGCTGGRHRSVLVAEELAAWLRNHAVPVQLNHRDLSRSSPGADGGGAGQDGNREAIGP
jgi:UPF0042 nucleotide-binding protein